MSQLNESKNGYRKDTATLNAEKENELAIAEKGDSIIERSGTYLSEAKKHNHINIEEKKKQNAYIAQTILSEIDKLIQSIEQDLNELKGYVRDAKKVAKEVTEEVDKAEKAFREAEILNQALLSKDENKLNEVLRLYSDDLTDDEIEAMPYEAKLAQTRIEIDNRVRVVEETEKFLKEGLDKYNDLKEKHKAKKLKMQPKIDKLRASGKEAEADALEKQLKESKNELDECGNQINDGIQRFHRLSPEKFEAGKNQFTANNDYCNDFKELIQTSINSSTFSAFKKGDIKNVFTNVSDPNKPEEDKALEVSEKSQAPKEAVYDNGGFDFS